MFNGNLPLILLVWMIVLASMATVRSRKGVAGVGLVLSYLLNFWMLFWAGSVPYLFSWYAGQYRDFTIAGAEQSLYGVVAFAFGSLALAPLVLDLGILPRVSGQYQSEARLPRAYLIAGVIFYALLSRFNNQVLSLNSILSAGQELVVVGLGLCAWQAWRVGDFRKLAMWLGLAFLPPVITIVTRGFIGYGAVATLSVLIFLSNFVRARAKLAFAALILGYLALSVFVTYMRDRAEIRASVWGGADFSDRISRVTSSAGDFEWFDPFNQKHLGRIDERLNQSYLVGAAVAHLAETDEFARGSTLRDSLLALIPRAIWPEKTITAGSGDLVARFTGFRYDNGSTSVGIGQVMEFYANFGTMGVLVGFTILGLIITIFDILATERLACGDLRGFVLWYLPGLAFMQVNGQLVEITVSAVASLVVALVVNRFLDRLQSRSAPVDPLAAAFQPGL